MDNFAGQCFAGEKLVQDGGKGGTYPGGWGSIGAVQGCPPELWTRLVGVIEIVATGGGF